MIRKIREYEIFRIHGGLILREMFVDTEYKKLRDAFDVIRGYCKVWRKHGYN